MHENKPEFHRKTIMSYEAHFHLRGYVNKQNCCIWSLENPKMIIEKPLYPNRYFAWKVSRPSDFKWFLETAITIGRWDHAI